MRWGRDHEPCACTVTPDHLVVLVDGVLCDAGVAEEAARMACGLDCALTVAMLLTPTWLTGLAPMAGVQTVSADEVGMDMMMRLTVRLDRFGIDWHIYPLVSDPLDELLRLLRRRPVYAVVVGTPSMPGSRRTIRLARRLHRRVGVTIEQCTHVTIRADREAPT